MLASTVDAIDKLIKGRHYPGYKDLLLINWDHFGDDARTAYTTGHSAAISWAASGKWMVDRLVEAYAINSFANHYLQDLFSAGRLRTPRRVLHGYMGGGLMPLQMYRIFNPLFPLLSYM